MNHTGKKCNLVKLVLNFDIKIYTQSLFCKKFSMFKKNGYF